MAFEIIIPFNLLKILIYKNTIDIHSPLTLSMCSYMIRFETENT